MAPLSTDDALRAGAAALLNHEAASPTAREAADVLQHLARTRDRFGPPDSEASEPTPDTGATLGAADVGTIRTGAQLADAPAGTAIVVLKEATLVDPDPVGAVVRVPDGWVGHMITGRHSPTLNGDARFRIVWVPRQHTDGTESDAGPHTPRVPHCSSTCRHCEATDRLGAVAAVLEAANLSARADAVYDLADRAGQRNPLGVALAAAVLDPSPGSRHR